MRNKKIILDMKNVMWLMIRIALPSLLSNIILALYYIADIFFVAKISDDAMAAISITYPINILVFSVAIGTGIGTTSVVSKLLGKQEREKANTIAGNAIIISLGLSIITTLIGFFFTQHIIQAVSSGNPVVDGYAVRYLKVLLIGSLGIFIPRIAEDILKGEGDAISPMLVLLGGAILNIILDPMFIFGFWKIPAMGIEGAAWATSISRLISGSVAFGLLFRKRNVLTPDFKKIKGIIKSAKVIYYFGIPSMLASIVTSTVVFSINWLVTLYEPDALAFTALMVTLADAIVFLPIYGLAQGFIPVASYNFGAKRYGKLMETTKYAIILSTIISGIGTLIFLIFPYPILMSFLTEERLVNVGLGAFKIVGISYLFAGPTIACAAAFQAVGKSAQLAIAAVMRSIVIFIPTAWILGRIYGTDGVWSAFIVTECLSLVIVATWLFLTLKRLPKTNSEI